MISDSRRKAKPAILAFAPHPWDNHWLSRQQLLTRLAQRGWPVLYSFGPLNWWERKFPRWQNAPWIGSIKPREAGVLVDYPGRWPPIWPKWPAWNQVVMTLHTARLLRALPPNTARIAMLFHPKFEPCLQWLKPNWIAYHVYDVYHLMDDWNPEKSAMESRLVQQADLISASSPGMAQHLPTPGPSRARILPNGADATRFAQAHQLPYPEELRSIPSPKIGYVGNINSKVDLEMITQMAIQHPQWHWVFMGPVYMNGDSPREQKAKSAWEQLLQRPNIHFLGLKSREAIPAYVYHMDVNVICYKIARTQTGEPDDWVVHGYPTKLHEYLATGKPVIAAPQEAIKAFADVVQIAETHAEWKTALTQALSGQGVGTPDARRTTALQNSWESRTDQLEQWLLELTDQLKK